MKKVLVSMLASLWTLAMAGVVPSLAAEGISAQLNSYEETPSTLTTAGTGVFSGLVSTDETVINYQLFYTDLQGTTVLFSHIHFGKPGESGGITVFLCGGGSKPACPAAGTVVSGSIVASDVMALAGQNLTAGDLGSLITAIKNGFAYVNVHTDSFPTGEIRGQLKSAAR